MSTAEPRSYRVTPRAAPLPGTAAPSSDPGATSAAVAAEAEGRGTRIRKRARAGEAGVSPAEAAVVNRGATIVATLSILNLLALAAVAYLLFEVSETHWLGVLATYLPRAPLGMPAVLLIAASLGWHRPSLWVNLAAILLVAGPLMEFQAPRQWHDWTAWNSLHSSAALIDPDDQRQIRIATCNVQAWEPDFATVLQELSETQPEIVCFQEARGTHPLLEKAFEGWSIVHTDYYWVGSRYPVTLLETIDFAPFERMAGLVVEVQHPTGPLTVANIHQMTARRAYGEISVSGLLSGETGAAIDQLTAQRHEESATLRTVIDRRKGTRPLIVAGDFNLPHTSRLYQIHWNDLGNAFSERGVGYGYTAPCRKHRFWVEGMPWARVDHVLFSPELRVLGSQVGRKNGSDHRLVAATLAIESRMIADESASDAVRERY